MGTGWRRGIGTGGLLLLALALTACASPAERRVRAAIEAVGGVERLVQVEGYALESTVDYVMEIPMAGEEPHRVVYSFATTESFERPGTHRSSLRSISPESLLNVDTQIEPDRSPRRSMGSGSKWSVLDHVEGPVARLHARVEASLVLPDLLLADDVELHERASVPIGDAQLPAVEVVFGDLPAVTYLFDPETDRIERVLTPAVAGVKTADRVIVLSDWRLVEGVLVAHQRDDPRPDHAGPERVVSIRLLHRAH